MEEEICEGKIYRCRVCGKEWDADGCRVAVVSGVPYVVEGFNCADCVAKGIKEDE